MRNPIIAILAFAMILSAVTKTGYAAVDETAGNKKELQRIKGEMREKKTKIKRADKKARSILADLDRIDRDIQTAKAELAKQQQQLREAEAALQDIEKNNTRISGDLVGLKRSYAVRIRALYKMCRSGYATAVLAPDGPDNGLKRIKYLGIIAERDRTLAQEYASALNALAAQQAEISEKKEAILGHKRTIETEETEFRSRKRQKATLLASVRKEKGLYEQTLRELEESSASLWAMIKKGEQERKTVKAVRPSRPKAATGGGSGRGRLPWPAEGRVLTRFGMQRHPQFNTMVFRRGIEIAVREGEPVRAVDDGQVVYADWYKGYGKLVIIEHGPGFYTLYGNLSRLDLNQGDRVTTGQALGLAGETGSLRGAKLYFEIRKNGEAQDPLAWLAKR